MTDEQQRRFDFLRAGPCVPGEYVRDYYGLKWPLAGEPAKLFNHFVGTLPRRWPEACPAGEISRFELEDFMASYQMVTKKWMAASFGMTPGSLDALLDKLDVLGMQRSRYDLGEFVAEVFSDDLPGKLPELRFRLFGSYGAYCKRIHEELRKAHIDVQPLFCATSEKMGDDPLLYARHFDCVTLEPLSTKHSAWLDFGKPMTLPTDRCSKLFYFNNRSCLAPYAAGSEPDHPELYTALGEKMQSA